MRPTHGRPLPDGRRSQISPVLTTLVAAAVVMAPLLLAGFGFRHGTLFRRPLWLDEWHTLLVAQQPSTRAVFHALARGADFNAPLLYLWHWLLGYILGEVTPTQLRATALVTMAASVIVLFLLLRRRFGTWPALAGALGIASASDIIYHAFDGRFYGPWLLLTLTYAVAIAAASTKPKSVGRQAAACTAAVALCLIHYFGIITLGLIIAGAAVALLKSPRRLLALVPSFVSGALTVLAMRPLLHAQRHALTVATWVPPPTHDYTIDYARSGAILLFAATLMLIVEFSRVPAPNDDSKDRVLMGSLTALALLPVLIAAGSWLVQPMLVVRYKLPYYLAIAPAAAAVVARLYRPLQWASVVALLVVGGVHARRVAREGAAFERRVERDSANAELVMRAGALAVAPTRHALYPLRTIPGGRTDRIVLPIVSPAMLRERFTAGSPSDTAWLADYFILEQEVAAVHSQVFGYPKLLTVDSLARLQCFYLLESSEQFVTRYLPERSFKEVRPSLFASSSGDARSSEASSCFTALSKH